MEKLKDNLPLFSVALVSFSLIRMVFYYHAFGIDITSYIELTEALILSIPFFISQLLLFGGLIFVGALFYELISDTRFAKPIIINHITGLKKEEYKESIKSNIPKLLFNILFACVIWLIAQYAFHDKVFSYLMAATSTTVMIDRSSLQKTLSHDINISKTAIDIIFLFIISSAFCIAGTKRQSVDVLESKDRTRALVKYESYSIVTSPNYRYIGKIKNYIFFYNKKLKRADVYPLADAKKILVISSNE